MWKSCPAATQGRGRTDPRRRTAAIIAFSAGLVTATAAAAHDGTGLAGGFISGFFHPFGGPDHMMAMVAVGLWGAVLRRPLLLVLPVVFPVMMAAGGVLGILGVPIPPVEFGIALSVLVLGGAIALGWRARVWVAVLLVAGFAVFHGYAHGNELPSAADPVGYSVGFVFSTGLLHLVGIGLGGLAERFGGLRTVRVLGGLIAAAGVWFLFKVLF